MRFLLVVGIACVLPGVAGALRQDPLPADFEGRTERGWIRLRNFASVSIAEDGTVRGTATGNPVVLEDTERGLTLTGKAMRIELVTLPGGKYQIKEVTVADGAHVLFDTEVAYKSALEFATAKSPAPPKPDAFQRTTLDSDSVLYRVDAQEGVLTLPQALKMTSDSRGEVLRKEKDATLRTPFVQNLQFEGTKGRFTIGIRNEGPKEVTELRTGRIDGPATMRLTRTETVPDPELPGKTKSEVTNMTGRADLLEADLDGPGEPNLVAIGNVQFEGDKGLLAGRLRGNKAVVTLDRFLKPLRYDFSGAPTTTTIRFKDGAR